MIFRGIEGLVSGSQDLLLVAGDIVLICLPVRLDIILHQIVVHLRRGDRHVPAVSLQAPVNPDLRQRLLVNHVHRKTQVLPEPFHDFLLVRLVSVRLQLLLKAFPDGLVRFPRIGVDLCVFLLGEAVEAVFGQFVFQHADPDNPVDNAFDQLLPVPGAVPGAPPGQEDAHTGQLLRGRQGILRQGERVFIYADPDDHRILFLRFLRRGGADADHQREKRRHDPQKRFFHSPFLLLRAFPS